MTNLSSEFSLKDLGHFTTFLVADLSTPMAATTSEAPNDNYDIDPTDYRRMMEYLQYQTLTRPNITFVVNKVCQHLQESKVKGL